VNLSINCENSMFFLLNVRMYVLLILLIKFSDI